MNMDDQMNYAVEPFSTNDKFLVETSHFSLPRNSIKTEPNYVNRDTWPTQPMISPLEVGCGNPRHPHILQQPIASSSLQRSPQKVVKKRHRQRRRKGADKGKVFVSSNKLSTNKVSSNKVSSNKVSSNKVLLKSWNQLVLRW